MDVICTECRLHLTHHHVALCLHGPDLQKWSTASDPPRAIPCYLVSVYMYRLHQLQPYATSVPQARDCHTECTLYWSLRVQHCIQSLGFAKLVYQGGLLRRFPKAKPYIPTLLYLQGCDVQAC